ncbi:BCCT family transporter [Clostridiaceae bacterium 35-E11]
MEKMKKGLNVDWTITTISVTCVFVIVGFMSIRPDTTTDFILKIFTITTDALGPFILWFVFLGLMMCLYLAFSKHGKIKLGNSKPEYSLFSYISMMICAALASASVYYSLTEWAYYYAEPTFRLEPYSIEAAEYATAYTFFHWGFSVQVVFVLTSLAIAYAVHVKKVPALRVSAVCEEILSTFRYKEVIGKVIDVICIFSILGGLGVSLGLGVPLISNEITKIFGIEGSFTMNVIIVLMIAAIFSLSSFVGIDKGMKKISDYTIYLAIGLLIFILITGPTQFIIRQTTNSVGIMLKNYITMSLWTDPIGNSGFPESWTIFLFAFALNYAALMGVFITKISKGRTIREVILSCLVGISVGTWILFGINGGFAMDAELTGKFSITEAVLNGTGQTAIYSLLDLLPGGIMISIVYLVIAIGFLSTSLDSAAFSLSATATKKLDASGNTSPFFRLFWCIILAAIPLSIMFTGAPFKTLQTLSIFVSVPFILVILLMLWGLFKWFREDNIQVKSNEVSASDQ